MTKQLCVSNEVYKKLQTIKNGDSYSIVLERLLENQTDTNGRINYLILLFEDIYREYPDGCPSELVCQLKDSLKLASLSPMKAHVLSNVLKNYLMMDIKEEEE